MGIKRIVDTSFWTDGKVDEFTPEDKYFMLYLLTNPFSTQLGIYEISIKQAAFHLGYSMETVRNLLDRFEYKYGMIIFSKATNEVAIKNFLRHSIVKGGKPVEDCIRKEMQKVKNKALITNVFNHINGKDDLNETVKKIVNEYVNENENENENDNDNDNDNDVSYPDTLHESSYDSSKQKKPTLHRYGTYKNVLLSDEDMFALRCEFPTEWEDRINRLSEYMTSKNKTYDNHLATIRLWARNEQKKQQAGNNTSSCGENIFLELAKGGAAQ